MSEMTPKELAQWGRGLNRLAAATTVDVLASGDAQVPAASYPNGSQFGVLMWSHPRPRPVVLSVGARGGVSINNPAEVFSDGRGVAMLVEYGVGAAVCSARMDMRTGNFQLPSCSFVRVSVIPTGTIATAAAVDSLAVSLADGAAVNTDVPSYTSMLLPGSVPNQARAVELPTPGRLVIGGASGTSIESDWTVIPSVFAPPYSPVRIDALDGATYVFTPAAAFAGVSRVRWLLSL